MYVEMYVCMVWNKLLFKMLEIPFKNGTYLGIVGISISILGMGMEV